MNNIMIEEMMKELDIAIDETLRKQMMSLGELIEKLESMDKSKPIVFAYPPDPENNLDYSQYSETDLYDTNHIGLGEFDSYRGYYRYLAIEPSAITRTVENALNNAKEALGKTYEGYKGGDYLMNADTLIWCAYWGNAPGLMITNITEYDEKVVVQTEFEKDDQIDHQQIAKNAENRMYQRVGRQVIGKRIKFTVEVGQLIGSKPIGKTLTFQKHILSTETFTYNHIRIPEGSHELPGETLYKAKNEALRVAQKHEDFWNNISRDIEPNGYWAKADHKDREVFHYWHDGFELCHYIRLQWSKWDPLQ